uniref:Uncharacterized protein n=2 Tax=Nicotiana TaxID=4085 RepID=A0A1S4DDV2_TOBAC|nr:PREDICTED: uncharacterized protein LOC104216568 [Nicotiana sylvestris]XP_009764951.1 PREDICTED: uncharacterized protein LOC104216568 [Nicotiana sylvestris]XP_016511513.1 PREDICTED: uncharacterized protein LOC107828665 [Nicotiana tabacum]
MQPDIRKEDLQRDQMQPMEATNYGSREKESAEVWNNTSVGTSDGIKTTSMRGLNIGLEKKDVQEQMPADGNMLNDTIKLQQNLFQVVSQMQDADNQKMKELQDNIDKTQDYGVMIDMRVLVSRL